MTDSLRTRIAAVVAAHRDQCGDCSCGWESWEESWDMHLADAVIRELGLELEAWKPENHFVVNGLHNMGIDPAVIYRYNTKWMTR